MAYPSILEVEKAEIGETYLVPSLWITPQSDPPYWAPIIGPHHEDSELGSSNQLHIHFDCRFLPLDLWEIVSYPSNLHSVIPVAWLVDNDLKLTELTEEYRDNLRRIITLMPWKCYRDFPSLGTKWVGQTPEHWNRLNACFRGKKLDLNCKTCPHKGIPLAGAPTKNGVARCPGHGLHWNMETGEFVERPATKVTGNYWSIESNE